MTIRVLTNRGVRNALVLQCNHHTVNVRLPDGNIIKRHFRKHVF